MKRIKQRLTKLIRPDVIIRLLGVLVLIIAAAIALLGYINQYSESFQDSPLVEDFYANVSAELASIAITILVIDVLNEWRQNRQLKEQLALQMCSHHNDVTDIAIRAFKAYGWLYDGSLKNANLAAANLEESDLQDANLEKADLMEANLEKVNLAGANLVRANLWGASLRKAILVRANLENAILFKANLRRADLMRARLGGATLRGANFKGASLIEAHMEDVDLEGANLKGAYLLHANLRNARYWTNEQLLQAKTLKGAIMPDGRKYEEWQQSTKIQIDEQALDNEGF